MIKYTLKVFFLLFFSQSFLIGQSLNYTAFNAAYDALLTQHVVDNKVNYESMKSDPAFVVLVDFVSQFNPNNLSPNQVKSFRINAYNIQVLQGVLLHYPIQSVQEINGFFDRQKREIEGMSITLNDYEKKYILLEYNDPRLHFVLVCGAVSCPPIISEAYTSEKLEEQLESQTKKALRDKDFIQINEGEVKISQIFQWYANDFGGNTKAIVSFINSYREEKLPRQSFSYYTYDWALNDSNPKITIGENQANSANRYVVSATIPKGSYEFKIFNNLYSQDANNFRSNFFTTTFSGLYGLTRNFNVGLTGRYRIVSNHTGESSPFQVFGGGNPVSTRNGLTGIGPMIRYAPVPDWENFSIQSSLTFSLGKNLQAVNDPTLSYIDYDGAVSITQFFNDFTLSSKFSLFTEMDIILEGIGFPTDDYAFRFSTPVTAILSYFPTSMSTLYLLGSYSPYWESPYDYFYQAGLGGKYQITSQFEVELLYNFFRNKFLLAQNGTAQTFNLGLRYTL